MSLFPGFGGSMPARPPPPPPPPPPQNRRPPPQRAVFADGADDADPLAMTFTVTPTEGASGLDLGQDDVSGGCFLTSVDIFFSAKDENIPVSLEIRSTSNGYPNKQVLPFGRVVKQAADIIPDTTAETPTTFTFPAPVYVKQDGEYAIALLTNSPEHKVWISLMGETPVGGGPTLSTQPHKGSLFKSHNNSAWAISPQEDMKFRLKRAAFDNNISGTVTLENNTLPSKRLKLNPLTFTHGDTALKVLHKDHEVDQKQFILADQVYHPNEQLI